jgi:hypothetical protein
VDSSGQSNDINAHGIMECEIEPPEQLRYGITARSADTENRFFGPLKGKPVTVGGTWVEDLSHAMKTEVHPLKWILVDAETVPGAAKVIELFVFSNSSSMSPVRLSLPPDNNQNSVAIVSVSFPAPPAGVSETDWNRYQMADELDVSQSKSFAIRDTNAQPYPYEFFATVESGTSNVGLGFYYGRIELGTRALFLTQSVPTAVDAGGQYPISISFRNTSDEAWTSQGPNPFRLGSQSPRDNMTWGISRVELPKAVAPGDSVSFSFTVVAPANSGEYIFEWQMLQEFVEWIGDKSFPVTVTGGPTVSVPDVTDEPATIAIPAIQKAGLVPQYQGQLQPKSWVGSQDPVGGTTVNRGSGVTLVLLNQPKALT